MYSRIYIVLVAMVVARRLNTSTRTNTMVNYVLIDEAHKVRTNMETYGGSFAKALAQAILHADSQNLTKIKNTWPDLWQHFLYDYNRNNGNQ